MSNRADGAYCTKDLVLRHPTNKTWFKYIGRLDDTLTQTLGEKTNPVPVELTIVSVERPSVAVLMRSVREVIPHWCRNASFLEMLDHKSERSSSRPSRERSSARIRRRSSTRYGR